MHAHSQENGQAMFNLGSMHEHMEGLPFDLHVEKWYYDQVLQINSHEKLLVMLTLLSIWIRKNYGDNYLVRFVNTFCLFTSYSSISYYERGNMLEGWLLFVHGLF